MIESKKYLTINQLAKVCSTSRSTLLRMEQDKILTPAYTDSGNGYRYYDVSSVLRVCRNLTLQELGITHRELYNYYEDTDNYTVLLNTLEAKMAMMEHHIADLKLHLHRDESLKISEYKFPEVFCYTCLMENVTDLTSVRPNIWRVFSEAIDLGYSLNLNVSPFVLVDYKKIAENNYQNLGYDYEICIPVISVKGDDSLKHFDAVETLSTIIYGGARDIQRAFATLLEECGKKKYASETAARVVTVVSSVPGEDIPLEYWVERVCIPIIYE